MSGRKTRGGRAGGEVGYNRESKRETAGVGKDDGDRERRERGQKTGLKGGKNDAFSIL